MDTLTDTDLETSNAEIDDLVTMLQMANLDEAEKLYESGVNLDIDSQFALACKMGNIIEATRIYDIGINIHDKDNIAFRFACRYGHINVAKWLYSLGADIYADCRGALNKAYHNEHVEIIRWLYSLGMSIDTNDIFDTVCKQNRVKLANLFYDLESDKNVEHIIEFILACRNGDLNRAKRLYKSEIDIHSKDDAPFRFACEFGHLDVAKWLYSLGANIHSADHYAFVLVCENEHVEVIKWLITVGIDINVYTGYAENGNVFDDACEREHISVAKLLYSLGADIHCSQAFIYSLSYGNSELVQWLYYLDNIVLINIFDSLSDSSIKKLARVLNFSETTTNLLVQIKNNEELHINGDVDDIVVRALLHKDKVLDLQKLNLPYVSYEVIGGKIFNGIIKRLKSKSARK